MAKIHTEFLMINLQEMKMTEIQGSMPLWITNIKQEPPTKEQWATPIG